MLMVETGHRGRNLTLPVGNWPPRKKSDASGGNWSPSTSSSTVWAGPEDPVSSIRAPLFSSTLSCSDLPQLLSPFLLPSATQPRMAHSR